MYTLSSDRPTYTYVSATPTNLMYPGQQVALRRNYHGTVTKPVTIKWFRQFGYYSARSPVSTTAAAFHNISGNYGTLTWHAIGRNESGYYECEVQNEAGSVSGRIPIRVYRKYMTVFSPLGAPNQACQNTGAGFS